MKSVSGEACSDSVLVLCLLFFFSSFFFSQHMQSRAHAD